MRDGVFYLALGPALLGLVVHLLWGLIFGLLVHRLRLTEGGAIIGGLVYGVLVMLVMFFIVLPVVGASFLLRVVVLVNHRTCAVLWTAPGAVAGATAPVLH